MYSKFSVLANVVNIQVNMFYIILINNILTFELVKIREATCSFLFGALSSMRGKWLHYI